MRHIVVMKPGEQGSQLYDDLLTRVPLQNDHVHFWPAFTFRLPENSGEIKNQLIQANLNHSTIVIVSPNAALMVKRLVSQWPEPALMATPGEPTAKKIKELWDTDTKVVFPRGGSTTSGSELLYERFLEEGLPRNVLIARGQTGREFLYDKLKGQGVNVKKLVVYERVPLVLRPVQKIWMEGLKQSPVIYLTSSDSVDVLLSQMDQSKIDLVKNSTFLTIHPRICDRLRERGCCSVELVDSSERAIEEILLQKAES